MIVLMIKLQSKAILVNNNKGSEIPQEYSNNFDENEPENNNLVNGKHDHDNFWLDKMKEDNDEEDDENETEVNKEKEGLTKQEASFKTFLHMI